MKDVHVTVHVDTRAFRAELRWFRWAMRVGSTLAAVEMRIRGIPRSRRSS